MRLIFLGLIPILAACSNPVDEALDRYAESPNATARCVAADEVSRAYLRTGDPQNAALWRTTSNSDCIVAENLSAASLTATERAVERAIDNALSEAVPCPDC